MTSDDRPADNAPSPRSFGPNDAYVSIWAEIANVGDDDSAQIAIQCLHPAGVAGTIRLEADGIDAVAPFVIGGGRLEPVSVNLGPAATARLRRTGSAVARAICLYTITGDANRRREAASLLLVSRSSRPSTAA